MCGNLRILSFCVLFCVFNADFAHAETLKEIVRKSFQNNPSILSLNAAKNAAEHEKKAEEAGFYPDLSAGLTAGRVYQDNATSRGLTTTRGAAYSGFSEANIALRQKIFDGYETKYRVGAAGSRVESMNFKLLDTQEQIILRLAQSYIDIARISFALSYLQEQSTQIKDYQIRIEQLVKKGVSDQTELEQARDVSMIISGAKVEYQGQLLSAIAQYHEVSGLPPPKKVEVPESVEPHIDYDLVQAIHDAKQSHPAILSAAMETEAAAFDMKAQEGQKYPDLGAEVSYLTSDKRDEIGGEAKDARAVLRLNWEFSLGGRGKASVRQRQSQHNEAVSRKEEITRQVEREIAQTYASHKTLTLQFQLAQQRVKLNKELLKSYNAQFEGSRISLLSLMRAESQLFNAKLEENDNFFNMLSAEYQILAATGNLKKVMLDLGNIDEK